MAYKYKPSVMLLYGIRLQGPLMISKMKGSLHLHGLSRYNAVHTGIDLSGTTAQPTKVIGAICSEQEP